MTKQNRIAYRLNTKQRRLTYRNSRLTTSKQSMKTRSAISIMGNRMSAMHFPKQKRAVISYSLRSIPLLTAMKNRCLPSSMKNGENSWHSRTPLPCIRPNGMTCSRISRVWKMRSAVQIHPLSRTTKRSVN